MGSRFQRGGGATVIAQPRTELLPGLDRPKAVLFLGGGLWLVNNLYGPIGGVLQAAFGQNPSTDPGTYADIYAGSLGKMIAEGALVAFLYVIAAISDEAGNISVLLLIALWVVWLILHVNKLNPSGAGKPATTTTAASTAKK